MVMLPPSASALIDINVSDTSPYSYVNMVSSMFGACYHHQVNHTPTLDTAWLNVITDEATENLLLFGQLQSCWKVMMISTFPLYIVRGCFITYLFCKHRFTLYCSSV